VTPVEQAAQVVSDDLVEVHALIEATIGAHRMIPGTVRTPATCSGCTWTSQQHSRHRRDDHDRHVVLMLAVAVTAWSGTDPGALDRVRAEAGAAALRAAADYLSDDDEAIETALRGVDHPIGVLRDRSARIEAEADR
jgi:hypothetical protein